MNEVLKKMMYLYIKPFASLFKRGKAKDVMNMLFKDISSEDKIYYYGELEKKISETETKFFIEEDVAIVLQGQIKYEDNFTLITLGNYRRLYPNTPIIVSTWEGEVKEEFSKWCNNNGIYIVENKSPENRGFGNVNCQIGSSFGGVSFVKGNCKTKYILKTRTDQRICKKDFVTYLKNMYTVFDKQENKKIMFLDSTYLYVPFYVADYLAFGPSDRIFELYSIPQETNECDQFKNAFKDDRDIFTQIRKNETMSFENFKLRKKEQFEKIKGLITPEMYISYTYYKKHINQNANILDISIYKDYFKFLKEYSIIVNERDLQLYWPKYSYRSWRDINSEFYGFGVDNSKWIDLYLNTKEEDYV